MELEQKKKCSKCGVSKPENAFYKSNSDNSGLQGWCKPCFQAYNKAHYAKKKEDINMNWCGQKENGKCKLGVKICSAVNCPVYENINLNDENMKKLNPIWEQLQVQFESETAGVVLAQIFTNSCADVRLISKEKGEKIVNILMED